MNILASSIRLATAIVALVSLLGLPQARAWDEPVVPGSGVKVERVGDDFEDENWSFVPNGAKSTETINKRINAPTGRSANGRWYEGVKRGYPDVVKRVPTPAGGLPGSTGALLLQTLRTGIPGRPSYRLQQDDFICSIDGRVGGMVPASAAPNAVVRVFLPPVAEWENRTGPHFAFRLSCFTTKRSATKNGLFSSTKSENENYWPGMFIMFDSETDSKHDQDYAWIRIRGNTRGGELRGRQITVTGWWTLGMSVSPDGAIHYYARPGTEELTAEDHITSQYPYGYRCERFQTFFFNVCNGDDNRTWSSKWIIDDPAFYMNARLARAIAN